MEEILKNNWFELHQQLGLPPLLPLYLFIINVLLDVMNECLKLDHKPYMKDEPIEIDSLDRQQVSGREEFNGCRFSFSCS